MSKTRDTGFLGNVIKVDTSGNVSFVSGSTTLATINTSGQLSGSSPVLSSSYALNADLLDGLDSTQFTLTSSFAAQTASFTAFSASVNTFTSSLNSFSASILTFTASQNILNGTYATTGSNTFAGIQTINSNLVVTGSITAQTLVVQTITSSVDFVTGSTRFGSLSENTHQFTGSVLSNGGIGIGTSAVTSGYSLDVNGPSYFRSSTTITGSSGMYYNIRTTSSADAAVFMFDGANTGYVGLNVGSNPNKFVIYYAADTRMAIDTSGRVGFGTASPGYNLEINSGSSAPTELAIVNTNAAGAARLSLRNAERDFIVTSNTADDLLSFAYGGSNRLQFHTSSQWFNSGNVGIGTSSPGEQLTLSRSSYPTIKFIDTTDNFSGYLQYHTEANEFRLLTITNHPLIFSTNDTEKMRIAAGGNVGIGTNNPSYLLHLQQATGNPAIFIKRVTNDTNFEISVQESRTRLRTWSTANDRDFFFDTDNAGTTRMIITGAGRVGIGVTAPDAGLQIAAPAQDDQLTLGSAANNRDHAAFIYSGGNKAEFLRYQSGVRLVLASSSNIQYIDVVPGGSVGVRLSAGNTSWSAYTSDERKKKNFETVPGLEALLQINPVKYHFKTQDDSETKKLGFIAQNIQPLIPEMVHPNGEKAEDGSDILTIIPDYILPVLTKAIQELKAENDTLKEILQRNNIQ
jgi:hypothetical protein